MDLPMYMTHMFPCYSMERAYLKGSTIERTEITDIAPTIATLLGIAFPSGTSGNPIEEVLD